MKKLSLFVSFLFILSACSNIERNATKANLDIIPIPQKMEIMDNVFNLDNNTVVVSDDEKNQFNATHLQTYLKKLFKSDVLLLKEANDNYIRLNIIDSDKCDDIGLMNDNEAYILNITSHGIEITSVDAAGIFYGIQTLLQMLPNDIFAETSHAYDNIEFPNMRIVDNPRFKYRGLMLDCSRTFYDVEYIKHLFQNTQQHMRC